MSLLNDRRPFVPVQSQFSADCSERSSKTASSIMNGSLASVVVAVELDGNSLTPDLLVELGTGGYQLSITDAARQRVEKARRFVDNVVAHGRKVYGITTGFGKFAQVKVGGDDLKDLQVNLIRSHAVGVGQMLSRERTRMMMVLRINVLAKGYSGVSMKTLQTYIDAFNADFLPAVPQVGSVGASGDLAPLAHLALGLMGEGRAWTDDGHLAPAGPLLAAKGLEPMELGPKEGISLINGTQFISALSSEALIRAELILRQADVVATLSNEVLEGSHRALDPRVHWSRPHNGQNESATLMRSLHHSDKYRSEIYESHVGCDRVQDAYSLRCTPQVHGVVRDTLQFIRGILQTEINSATDNPLVFSEDELVISCGNFHGEYPAKAADILAIAVHELASISERRTERMMNPAYSYGLPAFLTEKGGLNSGFMMVHVTQTSLVSENKVLCHPASVDTIPTSAGTEDHVSMGPWAARKVLQVVENVEQVIAIELLAACQALDLRRPRTSTEPLEKVYQVVRSKVAKLSDDRYMAEDVSAVHELLRRGAVWDAVKDYVQ